MGLDLKWIQYLGKAMISWIASMLRLLYYYSFCMRDMILDRSLINDDSIVTLDWVTSIFTDPEERIAVHCQCGEDILSQIANGTEISELCGPRIFCESLCMYPERDGCNIAVCGEETPSHDVCVFQTHLSAPELVTVIVNGLPCNSILDTISTTCGTTPSSDQTRNIVIVSTSLAIVLLMLALIAVTCFTAMYYKLKKTIKRYRYNSYIASVCINTSWLDKTRKLTLQKIVVSKHIIMFTCQVATGTLWVLLPPPGGS